MKFSGPIPGESLTSRPGQAAWEQPPQFTRVDEVFKYYLKNLEAPDALDDIFDVLDDGLPLDLLIDSTLTMGAMQGKHTVDMNYLVGPLLHEYVAGLAEAAGIEFIEFQSQLSKKVDHKDLARFKQSFEESLKDNKNPSALSGALDNLEAASESPENYSQGEEEEEEEDDGDEMGEASEAPPSASTGLVGRPVK